MDCIDSLITDH